MLVKHPHFGRLQEKIFRALARYYCLTNEQLNAVVYRGNGASAVRGATKQLLDMGYLRLSIIPTYRGLGCHMYSLDERAASYLRSQGMTIHVKGRKQQTPTGFIFLRHTRDVNDFLIAAELLPRTHPEIELMEMVHDEDLRREPFYVETKKEKRLGIAPDGWLHFRWSPGLREEMLHARIWVEVDRGTEDQADIRRKVRGILACTEGPYRRRFGTNNITVAFWATEGQGRVAQLLHWIEAELVELGTKKQADLFRVAKPHEGKNPFLDPIWEAPWSMQIYPLLPVKGGYEQGTRSI